MKNTRFFIYLIFYLFSTSVFSMGYVERYSLEMISGWACDVRYPDDIVAVHAWRDDNQFLGGTSAEIYREPAVASACRGNHSIHGFDLQINITEDLKDGKEHRVHIYLIGRDGFVEQINNSPIRIKFPGDGIRERPYFAGDVVARDLNYPIIGGAGHIGIWDGSHVIEVLNEQPVVQRNTYERFFQQSNVWPILRTTWPEHDVIACFSSSCTENLSYPTQNKPTYPARYAMMARANQIYAIGASYTLTPYMTPSEPTVILPPTAGTGYDTWTWPPIRGEYRCDTFILDVISASVRSTGFYSNSAMSGRIYPSRIIESDISSWHKKYMDAATIRALVPASLYNKIKEWQ